MQLNKSNRNKQCNKAGALSQFHFCFALIKKTNMFCTIIKQQQIKRKKKVKDGDRISSAWPCINKNKHAEMIYCLLARAFTQHSFTKTSHSPVFTPVDLLLTFFCCARKSQLFQLEIISPVRSRRCFPTMMTELFFENGV